VTSWQRLVRALGDRAGLLRLRPPATETQLVAAETMMALRLPADYRAWLAGCDGQELDALSILPRGGWFASIDRVVSEWVFHRNFDAPELDTTDDALVRSNVFDPKRVTIGGWEDLGGDSVMIDLLPGPRGTPGQLLTLYTECDFAVIGTSLADYFERVAVLIERGELTADLLDANDWHELVEIQ
jgi:cell wall assembly regulator SMI1